MENDGTVTIWASDFDAGSFDDCTAQEDLIFSFTPLTSTTSRTFDCFSLGFNFVQIWVTDEAGNQDFCITTIIVADNGHCQDLQNVSGLISTEEEQGVPIADVRLYDGGEMMDNTLTNDEGEYAFEGDMSGNQYTIIPTKNDDPLNGVSTLDLVMIQRHILGVSTLDSPYKLIAADINSSESISAIDLVQLRKLILGYYNNFPDNESWRFVDESFEFQDPTSPWPFEEVIELEQSLGIFDFTGVKIGDVNGSVELGLNSNEQRNDINFDFEIENQNLEIDQIASIPVMAGSSGLIDGFQLNIETNNEVIEIIGVEGSALNIDASHFNIIEGTLRLSWSELVPVEITKGDELFELVIKVKSRGELSNNISILDQYPYPEIYNSGRVEGLAIKVVDERTIGELPRLFQNEPNPFGDKTNIGFYLPDTDEISLKIYNVTGELIKVINGTFEKGIHTISFSKTDLGASGIYYYRLETGAFGASKKMILLD